MSLFAISETIPEEIWKQIPPNKKAYRIGPLSEASRRVILAKNNKWATDVFGPLRKGMSADGRFCTVPRAILEKIWRYVGPGTKNKGGAQTDLTILLIQFKPYCVRVEVDEGRLQFEAAPAAEKRAQKRDGVRKAIKALLESAPVVSVPISELRNNPGQQEKRLTERSTADLFQQIEETGLVAPISVARWGGVLYIGDGHGRVQYLKSKEMTHVEAKIVDCEPHELLSRMNRPMRTPRADFHMSNWAKATDPAVREHLLDKVIKKGIRGKIRWLVAQLGEERTRELGKAEDFNPTMVQWARVIQTHLGNHALSHTGAEVINWMIKMTEAGFGVQGWYRFVRRAQQFEDKRFAVSVSNAIKRMRPAPAMREGRKKKASVS